MDEPVICSTVNTGDFSVTVAGNDRSVLAIENCAGTVDDVFDVVYGGTDAAAGQSVNVTLHAFTVSDEFGNSNFPDDSDSFVAT